ncbi:HAMP domain-containing sensor histidine kinase [Nocardia sp. NPDC051990]|uniref:sensor histidine kinase n=1 Tax=Nocardia sp. NPDC051990 TaxID=3155285 RepID=UPI00342D5400
MLRIGLQSGAAVLVTVLLLSVAVIVVVSHNARDDQNRSLATAIAEADDVNDPPARTWLVIRRAGGTQVSPGLPPGLPDEAAIWQADHNGAPRTAEVSIGDRRYRIRTEQRGDAVIQAVYDLQAAQHAARRLVTALLMCGAIGMLLAVLTGAWVARRAVTPLIAALALQRRFVADAGHELRTPLTLLSTRAQLLRRHLRGHPAEAEVDSLVVDAGQLADILDDLLLAADPRQEAQRRPFDLAALLREAVAAAEPAAGQRGVQLELIAAPVRAQGFQAGLRRAVNALLDNGIRHADRMVRVVLDSDGRHVRIDVADDGPGIDTDVLPLLFTRFASTPITASPSERRRYGLGLSLVSDIAARHGGTVSARNRDGGGATLSMTLPTGSQR